MRSEAGTGSGALGPPPRSSSERLYVAQTLAGGAERRGRERGDGRGQYRGGRCSPREYQSCHPSSRRRPRGRFASARRAPCSRLPFDFAISVPAGVRNSHPQDWPSRSGSGFTAVAVGGEGLGVSNGEALEGEEENRWFCGRYLRPPPGRRCSPRPQTRAGSGPTRGPRCSRCLGLFELGPIGTVRLGLVRL